MLTFIKPRYHQSEPTESTAQSRWSAWSTPVHHRRVRGGIRCHANALAPARVPDDSGWSFHWETDGCPPRLRATPSQEPHPARINLNSAVQTAAKRRKKRKATEKFLCLSSQKTLTRQVSEKSVGFQTKPMCFLCLFAATLIALLDQISLLLQPGFALRLGKGIHLRPRVNALACLNFVFPL